MFGVGIQEMVLIGVLFLVIFGPGKVPDMARDVGRFVNEARRAVEEFKVDLALEEKPVQEPRNQRDPEVSQAPEENARSVPRAE